MQEDILQRLRVDAGQCTIGQIIQDREAARIEINRLRADNERLRQSPKPSSTIGSAPGGMSAIADRRALPAGAILRLSDVCNLLGLSRSTIYRRMIEGTFPQPLWIGGHSVRWRLDAIESWRDALTPRLGTAVPPRRGRPRVAG